MPSAISRPEVSAPPPARNAIINLMGPFGSQPPWPSASDADAIDIESNAPAAKVLKSVVIFPSGPFMFGDQIHNLVDVSTIL